uniref:Uncharacterized protein n=1 Tax=Romanomermis culicivorax TaxID=13658 RepID=A0A915JVJ3_ROMCU
MVFSGVGFDCKLALSKVRKPNSCILHSENRIVISNFYSKKQDKLVKRINAQMVKILAIVHSVAIIRQFNDDLAVMASTLHKSLSQTHSIFSHFFIVHFCVHPLSTKSGRELFKQPAVRL